MSSSYQLLWGVTPLKEAEMGTLTSVLTASERERAHVLTPVQSTRYLAGRYLARQLGAQMLETEWTAVVPSAHCEDCGMDHGAINLVGTDLSISLSSTGSRLVAAGIRGHRIGIDIEQGQLEDRREIAARTGNLDVTLAQWCEYESVVKAAGVGISLSIDEIHFTTIAGRKTAGLSGVPDRYEVIPATQHDDVVLAVALSR